MANHFPGLATHDSSEAEALADRLRFAATSLAAEFEGLPPVEAERLIFGIAREFLADAHVPQFVPTFATRRARQLLRARRSGATAFVDLVAAEADADAAVAVAEVKVQVGVTIPDPPAGSNGASGGNGLMVPVPLKPLTHYAGDARRLLERARALRVSDR